MNIYGGSGEQFIINSFDSLRSTSTVLGDQVIGNAGRTGSDHQVEVFVGAIREPSSDQVDDDEICLAY